MTVKRRPETLEFFLGEWENRKNKYPWVLTIGTLLLFFLSILIGLFQDLEDNYFQSAFNFCFQNYASLILWIPDAFLIGFLKNRNRTWDPQASGSLIKSFIYGLTLFIGVYILFWGLSTIFDLLAYNLVLDPTTELKYEFSWALVLASAIGAFFSISLRGPQYEKFLPIED